MRAVQIKIFLPEWFFRLRIRLVFCYRWLRSVCSFRKLRFFCPFRRIRYGCTFRVIPLTQGKFAIVDPEDYDALSKYKWYAVKRGRQYYAVAKVGTKKGGHRQKKVRMHRLIMKAPKGKVVDHINHNGLDNRKANLRLATAQQNTWNKRKQKGNYSSQYKGVHWVKSENKWRSRITCNGKVIFIGRFDDEKAAAMAYDAKAKELFGEYASLNLELHH